MNKKVIDFVGKSKIFFGISIAILLIGIGCNIVFGTTLDISFTGGTMVTYSYVGDVDEAKMKNVLQTITEDTVSFSVSNNLMAAEDGSTLENGHFVAVQFSGTKTITPEVQDEMTAALQKEFSENNFDYSESNSVEASMGVKFFWKSITAIALASVIMVLYVAMRFRKIGGFSAGIMALVALFHDILIIYFTFVIFRMPLDGNFVAVVLMILGYSLNDTIIVYDRIRENKAIMGRKTDVATIFNTSSTQVIRRTICTTLTTLTAVGCVYVAAIVFNLDSVKSFAFPMMIGMISGCYSSLCIAGPLWVRWQKRDKDNKSTAKR